MRRRHALVILAALIVPLWACAEDLPPWQPLEDLSIEVTGDNYRWHFRYPGRDGRLGTDDDVRDDGPLHLPENTPVELRLRSADYMYHFRLPTLGLSEMAAPDLLFSLHLRTAGPGSEPVLGDQFCGYAHENLITELVIEPEQDFKEFVDATRKRN